MSASEPKSMFEKVLEMNEQQKKQAITAWNRRAGEGEE